MPRRQNSIKKFISSAAYTVKYIKKKISEIKNSLSCNCNDYNEDELKLEIRASSRSLPNIKSTNMSSFMAPSSN